MYGATKYCLTLCLSAYLSCVKCDEFLQTYSDNSNLMTIKLYHSFNEDKIWSQRNTIVISRSEMVEIKGNELNEDESNQLEKAGGYYYLKAVSSKDERVSQTFIKACAMKLSALSDHIEISIDNYGNFLGVGITTTNPYCNDEAPQHGLKLKSFNTTVTVVQTGLAPSPDTQTYMQRLEHEKIEKLRGDKSENKSFFAKYWMYIVPVVIFLMISSAANPEGQGGGR